MHPQTGPDMEAIEALIDGELDTSAAQKLHARILSDPHLRARYETLCRQKALLQIWWGKFSKN